MPAALCKLSQVLFYLLRLEPFTKLGRALQARSWSRCAYGVCTAACRGSVNQCSVGGARCGAVPACCLTWSAVPAAAGVRGGKADWLSPGSFLAARLSLPLSALSQPLHWLETMHRHRPTIQCRVAASTMPTDCSIRWPPPGRMCWTTRQVSAASCVAATEMSRCTDGMLRYCFRRLQSAYGCEITAACSVAWQ